MMIRSLIQRAIGASVLFAPMVLLAQAQGCGSQPLPQNICNCLGDSNNCYALFASDVGTRCADADVSEDPVEDATGYFSARDDLSICVREAGGQVIFDPPLDVTTFPVSSVAFSILDEIAMPCGSGSVGNEQTYSITIDPVDGQEAGIEDDVVGGTISFENPEGTPTLNVTCPGGLQTHNFNTLVLNKCPEVAGLAPRAVLDSSPGIPPNASSAGRPGYVRLQVYYPPEDPAAAGATPRIVQYFDCTIPPPPHPCQDGLQNNDETDIDCGGSCAAKCAEGQGCNDGEDCTSGNCGLNGGFKQCLP